MNDYAVKKALAKREGQQNNAAPAQSVNGIPNSVLTDVFSGKRRATNEMMGHREELAPSIAAKMSQAFGMDFSAVKVYRSDAMAGTEMHGMAQGDKVVLSSDVDLNTQAGQATLGHELSHIRAQSMGMGSGRGLLNDASLEHQADSEGILAARGMSVSGETMGMSMGLGMAGVEGLSPIGAGLGATAAAPMQAQKGQAAPAKRESFRLSNPLRLSEQNRSLVRDECNSYVQEHFDPSSGDTTAAMRAFDMDQFITNTTGGMFGGLISGSGKLDPGVLRAAFLHCQQSDAARSSQRTADEQEMESALFDTNQINMQREVDKKLRIPGSGG